jgi:hypothetical protein
MALANAMLVSPTVLPSPLKVLSIDETAVDVVVRERDGAELLKIEVEGVSIDLEFNPGGISASV